VQVSTIANLDCHYPDGTVKKVYAIFGFDSISHMAMEFKAIKKR
jgi:hypothetical protein